MSKLDLLEDLKMNLPCLQNKDGKNAILLSLDEMEEVRQHFEKIANQLINHYCIVKKKDTSTEVVYRFMELEFYYCCSKHLDVITYPREAKAGEWFFHNSGVDICFESNVKFAADSAKPIGFPKDYAFGGILIRALSKHVKSKDGKEDICYITGPLNCCYELFDKFPAFPSSENTLLGIPFIKEYDSIIEDNNSNSNKESNPIVPQSCGRYFKFSTTLTNKLTNIYKEVWGKAEKEAKDVDDSTFQDYLEMEYRFYDKQAFEKYDEDRLNRKLGKSYQANPTKSKKRLNPKES